jgi:YidC/Oxa1 family membrane protein insertase
MAPQQQKTMRVMALVVMPISAIATSFLSSGITWYFLVSAALHTIQTWLMHQPWFRRIVRLPPLQAQAPAAPVSGGVWHAPRVINASAPRVHVSTSAHSPAQPAHESLFDSLKKSIADTKKAMDERADRFEAERAIKTAQEYEEKRALEEKERLLARLERKKGRY